MNFDKRTIKKISTNRKRLEKELNIKLEIKGNSVDISGNELEIYVAEKVFQAIEKNFPVNTALLLTSEDYMLESISIKSISKRKNISQIKARIIGTKGKTLKLLSELSECHIALHNNIVSIIGTFEKIKIAESAIKNLIKGSKQANVYFYLEKHKKNIIPED